MKISSLKKRSVQALPLENTSCMASLGKGKGVWNSNTVYVENVKGVDVSWIAPSWLQTWITPSWMQYKNEIHQMEDNMSNVLR